MIWLRCEMKRVFSRPNQRYTASISITLKLQLQLQLQLQLVLIKDATYSVGEDLWVGDVEVRWSGGYAN